MEGPLWNYRVPQNIVTSQSSKDKNATNFTNSTNCFMPPGQGQTLRVHRLDSGPAGKRACIRFPKRNNEIRARFPAGPGPRRWPKATPGRAESLTRFVKFVEFVALLPLLIPASLYYARLNNLVAAFPRQEICGK
jgi:hypothetical protein